MMWLFPQMLVLPDVMARAKYCQVINPDRTNSGYGSPSDGIAARLPKTNVNPSVLRSGLSTAQPTPKIACLYCTPIWRQVKTNNNSYARATSARPVSYHGDAATIRVMRCGRGACAGAGLASAWVRATYQDGPAAVMCSSVGRSAARPGGR